MKNKKNIDRLFQERFKDFETEPDEQIWLNIQAALKEDKKERKIVPIWFKYTGIAASLLLGFFALSTIFKPTTDLKNAIVLDQEIVIIHSSNIDSIVSKNPKDVKKLFQNKVPQITATNDDKLKSNRKITIQLSTNSQSKNSLTKSNYQNSATVYQKEHHRSLDEVKVANETHQYDESFVVKDNLKNQITAESILNKNNTILIVKDKLDSKVTPINFDKKETTSVAATNELEEILKEKEGKKELAVVVVPKNKWELISIVAPMYLKTNSSKSPIDSQLTDNKKTTDTGFSYGIGISYALSSKVVLRSGINAFSVGYNTNDVSFSTGLNTNSLANVNYTSNNAIEIQSQATLNGLTSIEKDLQKISTGSLNQKMGYYEVPLELSYAVLNKIISINIIGGVSTLFLKQNEIALVSPQANFKLGEATNLNTLHFSTNFGFGFKYKFAKSLQLNFEPMLKYQFNTYSKETGNYNPVFIGLYSGISYRF